MKNGALWRGGCLVGEFATQAAIFCSASLVDVSLTLTCGAAWMISAIRFASSIGGGINEQEIAIGDRLNDGDRR